MTQLPTPQEYVERHKKAFRDAFNFLNAHFPPQPDADWWKATTEDITAASLKDGENKLIVGLLTGVFDYLDSESKLRREDDASVIN